MPYQLRRRKELSGRAEPGQECKAERRGQSARDVNAESMFSEALPPPSSPLPLQEHSRVSPLGDSPVPTEDLLLQTR